MVKGGLLDFDAKWSTLEHLDGLEFVNEKFLSICKAALGPKFIPEGVKDRLRKLKVQ